MAPLVPLESRRDLKPPAFLHLDPAARFPRLSVRAKDADRSHLFGPFRDRRAAERARQAVHRVFPLRPCEYGFEPHPELPLGLGCVFAQVRSCAAPCLGRVSEDDYRALAVRAEAWLADAQARPRRPPRCRRSSPARRPHGARRRPRPECDRPLSVEGGRVADDAAATAAPDAIEAALAALRWDPPAGGGDDWPWLLAWLRRPKSRAFFVPVSPDEPPARLAERVRAVLPPRFGGNVGRSRGQG